jgi:uncharacterized membrane protein YeiB
VASTGGETRREDSAPRQTVGRMLGLDVARGLAVFGMFAAHVGPDPFEGGYLSRLYQVAHGRSSALFAVLAGVALIIIAGHPVARTGLAGRQAVAKIVIRSVILLAFGTALTMTGTSVAVILAYFGVFFLLALPFVRMRARTLAAVALVWALAGPQLHHLIQHAVHGSESYTADSSSSITESKGSVSIGSEAGSVTSDSIGNDAAASTQGSAFEAGWANAIATYDPMSRLSGEGIIEILFTGTYPALSWLPFLLAGMTLGRLGLASTAVRRKLAVLGPALAVLGYGCSWLAFQVFPDVAKAAGGPDAWWLGTDAPGASPAALLVAAPHSETTLSVIGNTGVAITIIVAALALTDRSARLRRLAKPVIAVGSMSLTAYVLHIAGIWLVSGGETPGSAAVLWGFVAAVMVFAVAWKRFFRWGPLEYVVHRATLLARRVP